MRTMRAACLVVCLGCASDWAPAGAMLLGARNNALAATQTYQSKELKLAGVVVSTGKKAIEHDTGRSPDGRWVEAPSASADLDYPFVVIRDAEHPSVDYVTCYLGRDDGVPQVAPGTTVHVDGFVLEFVMSGGHVDAVMNRCSVVAVPTK
jgi:hypothetical protein